MVFKKHAGVDYRIRRGLTDEWKTVLTHKQVERINEMIPSEFWGLFGWQP